MILNLIKPLMIPVLLKYRDCKKPKVVIFMQAKT